jgi:imidazole glycerol-phosphate synthase subunit HisH
MDVILIDAGGTNIGSVRYALQRLGVDAELTADAERIRSATHVILPGVGAAGPGMRRLHEAGLVDVVRSLRQPVLGVCLGMQLLCDRSDEGDVSCLGVVPAEVHRFGQAPGVRVPHMGWNQMTTCQPHRVLDGLGEEANAYFVHSYAVPVGDYTLASTDYNGSFSAVIAKDNFIGMQFHPERSGGLGARLLKNFLSL